METGKRALWRPHHARRANMSASSSQEQLSGGWSGRWEGGKPDVLGSSSSWVSIIGYRIHRNEPLLLFGDIVPV